MQTRMPITRQMKLWYIVHTLYVFKNSLCPVSEMTFHLFVLLHGQKEMC